MTTRKPIRKIIPYSNKSDIGNWLIELSSVFIAVLLAFSLNNWNDNRNNYARETKILAQMYNGIVADIGDAQSNMRGHKKGREIANHLIELISAGKNVSDTIDIFDYENLFRTYLAIQNTSGYESLKSIGLNNINNDTLRTQIINLYEIEYEFIEKLEENYFEGQLNQAYFEKVNSCLAKYYMYDTDNYDQIFKGFNKITE